ncbi:winged helix DNA-binding domain-containing protein, partial [Acinetobacter baumannii]|nr:winged helix DNA-binding domain-containing protein [Acinetobacter baumannii]
WKPHKRHLEGLFTAGEVMVVERRNFHRVYDLTRRVMPDWDDERDALSREDAEAIMLRNSARSLGIFRAQWLADYYRLRQPALPGLLAAWQEEGLVVPVNVEALGEMWLHHEALAQLDVALDVRRSIDSCTLAEKQQILLARALSHHCRFLILDEPTAPLDQHESERLFAVVRRLQHQGIGVVFISHRIHELKAICDPLTVLRDGRLIESGPMAPLSGEQIVEKMLGHELRDIFPPPCG